MQLLVTDKNPHNAAANLDDRSVVTQIMDCMMILCAKANSEGHAFPYKAVYPDHGLIRWVRNDKNNFFWVMAYCYALTAEFQERFGCHHKCDNVMWGLMKIYSYEKAYVKAFMNRAMIYSHVTDVPTAYRLHMDSVWENSKVPPKWTNKQPPDWYIENETLHTPNA